MGLKPYHAMGAVSYRLALSCFWDCWPNTWVHMGIDSFAAVVCTARLASLHITVDH